MGTPLAGLHTKERFFEQGECLAQGMTVREAAAERSERVVQPSLPGRLHRLQK